jgi:hypothetical protein
MLLLATNRLNVTAAAGLIQWNYLRKKSIRWSEIRTFGVCPGRARMRRPAVIMYLSNGSVIVTNVGAYTKNYLARIADEPSALQRELAHCAQNGREQPTELAS